MSQPCGAGRAVDGRCVSAQHLRRQRRLETAPSRQDLRRWTRVPSPGARQALRDRQVCHPSDGPATPSSGSHSPAPERHALCRAMDGWREGAREQPPRDATRRTDAVPCAQLLRSGLDACRHRSFPPMPKPVHTRPERASSAARIWLSRTDRTALRESGAEWKGQRDRVLLRAPLNARPAPLSRALMHSRRPAPAHG